MVAPATATTSITAHHKNHTNHSSKQHLTSKTPLTTQTYVVLSESDRRIDTVLRRRVQTPDPNSRRENMREEAKAKRQRQHGLQLCRAAASTRPLAAPLIRSEVWCKAARVRAEAREAEFPERDASVLRRTASQLASSVPNGRRCVAKGRETRVEPTDVYSCPPQEGGYSAREARKADPRKTANSESHFLPFAKRKGIQGMLHCHPCPRSGDAGRVWTTDASGLTPALRSI